jgi:hypothetical protein
VATTATRTLAPGEHHIADHGHLRVRLDRHHDGLTVTVMCGPTRNNVLSRTFLNHELAAARVWYRDLTAAADAGVPVWRIEADMQALADAGHALTHA